MYRWYIATKFIPPSLLFLSRYGLVTTPPNECYSRVLQFLFQLHSLLQILTPFCIHNIVLPDLLYPNTQSGILQSSPYICLSYSLYQAPFQQIHSLDSGPGSSVGIATDYGLDDPGPNPGGVEIFRPSRPALGNTQPPVL